MNFSSNGMESKISFINKINFQIFFFQKIKKPTHPYKSYITIKNMFGHKISHITMYSTMFWGPGVTLLRLLRCNNKRHFALSKEYSAPPYFNSLPLEFRNIENWSRNWLWSEIDFRKNDFSVELFLGMPAILCKWYIYLEDMKNENNVPDR